ncbi:MAG: PatB family C-S lyase [Kiritimatiellae bacterium]|nr:PatB family C-S lyase [Kiritimatiellia bacterium]
MKKKSNSNLPPPCPDVSTRGQALYDFDREISRGGSHCVKYDERLTVFGRADVIPLWVADMDFAAPQEITEALIARARHPIYGYTRFPDTLYDAVINWVQQRHGWSVPREWIVFCPGVVPSLNAAINAFTNVGDPVIIQPPVYHPFFSAITNNQRKLLPNPLRLKDGRYTIDFDHLAQCARQAQLLLLCSPHNPVGRVWDEQELTSLLEIAEEHDLVIVSDEIHADLIYPGHKHHVTATLTKNPRRVITALSPSKTFNIPGLSLSTLIISDAKLRARMTQVFNAMHINAANPFSIVAFETAYQAGAPWLEALLHYLQGTRAAVETYLTNHLPEIKLIQPQGTYLLWLDCRALKMTDAQLKDFFVHKAGIGMNPGTQFGEKEGSGFMRLNIGAPRKIILSALQQV